MGHYFLDIQYTFYCMTATNAIKLENGTKIIYIYKSNSLCWTRLMGLKNCTNTDKKGRGKKQPDKKYPNPSFSINCIRNRPKAQKSCLDFVNCWTTRNSFPGVMKAGMTFTVEPAISEGTQLVYLLQVTRSSTTNDDNHSMAAKQLIIKEIDQYHI